MRFVPPATAQLSEGDAAMIARVAPFTLTSLERMLAVIDAARYIARARIPGAVVECGVWRGGSMMAAALALREVEPEHRDLYLFDTFSGMTEPEAVDVDYRGGSARTRFDALKAESRGWCDASVEDVRQNLLSVGYEPNRLKLIEGRVEDTIPASAPDAIALLRLDTDWYQSTRHELEHLYPRLVPGGVLIIDDYGHWAGARRAVDEYFAANPPAPLLARIDYTARLAVKPA